MNTKNILEVTVEDLIQFFGKGRFATVSFLKKDGELRTLTGKTQVDKGINGNGASYEAKDYGQLRIFDVNIRDNNNERIGGWRTVTAANIKEVVANGTKYIVG